MALEPRMPTMSENYDLVDNVRKWVAVDTALKKLGNKTKEYRDMKTKLSESICTYAQTHNMQHTKIEITDGVIRFVEKREYSPLTFSYIETSLHKIIPNPSQVEYIIKYLKDNREVKVVQEMRRTYDN
jgi:Zn/Cd-binding protein ZinT